MTLLWTVDVYVVINFVKMCAALDIKTVMFYIPFTGLTLSHFYVCLKTKLLFPPASAVLQLIKLNVILIIALEGWIIRRVLNRETPKGACTFGVLNVTSVWIKDITLLIKNEKQILPHYYWNSSKIQFKVI